MIGAVTVKIQQTLHFNANTKLGLSMSFANLFYNNFVEIEIIYKEIIVEGYI